MLKLTDIRKDALLTGIVPGQAVKVVSVEPIGEDAVTVYYRDEGGQLAERMLFRSDEAAVEIREEGRQCTSGLRIPAPGGQSLLMDHGALKEMRKPSVSSIGLSYTPFFLVVVGSFFDRHVQT